MAHSQNEANRQLSLVKQREKDREKFEEAKKKIDEKTKLKTLTNKFQTHHDTVSAALSDQTVGMYV